MRSPILAAIGAVFAISAAPCVGYAQSVDAKGQSTYSVVPVATNERSGPSRDIRCSVGQMRETTCTFTPLFGDGSFQLDGPDIAIRLLLIEGEGRVFEVFGPTHRVPVGGIYIRNPRDRACWITTTTGPSPICAR